MGFNAFVQISLFLLMYMKFQRFQATYAACELIKVYYLKIDSVSKVQNICISMYLIYAVWTLVDLVLIILRVMSLVYMGKSWKFLKRKQADKKKRAEQIADKKKKIKRSHKREI